MSVHVSKKKESKNLVWIDTPTTKEESKLAALKVWRLYQTEFSLSAFDIANLLDCEIQWVRKYVQPEVKHIFVSRFFRDYMQTQLPEQPVSLLRSRYYFSKIDFQNWLDTNTIRKRSTKMLYGEEATIYLQQHPSFSKPRYSERAGKEQTIEYPLSQSFLSLKSIVKKGHFGSNEQAYKYLFSIGAVKYVIKNSLIRYNPVVLKRQPQRNGILVFADST